LLPTLSRLSVSYGPRDRLRHWCSSRYLRISPLHLEFHLSLPNSRLAVSKAVLQLSCRISPLTYKPACAPFIPSKSGQRLPPTYYRGCWHVVSRGLFLRYSQSRPLTKPGCSSLKKEVYNLTTFILHAALLGQAFAHCPIFLTAASRRSLDRVSVPVWGIILSEPLDIAALVSRYLTNKLIECKPIHRCYRSNFNNNIRRCRCFIRY
jgi:hypothetical protein